MLLTAEMLCEKILMASNKPMMKSFLWTKSQSIPTCGIPSSDLQPAKKVYIVLIIIATIMFFAVASVDMLRTTSMHAPPNFTGQVSIIKYSALSEFRD